MSDEPMTRPTPAAWRPTAAHTRACAIGVGLTLVAGVVRRPDLLVLATPLLVVAGWGAATRPRSTPTLRHTLAHTSVREDEATLWRAELTGIQGMEQVAAFVAPSPWVVRSPAGGGVAGTVPADAKEAALQVAVQSRRWGRRSVGPALVSGHSAWAAFRWGSQHCAPLTLTTLPLPSAFDASAPTPHPRGLVGLNRSSRTGDGAEFAGIRPFQAGDRVRRVHWPVSLRTGSLHVTSTWADQDSHVVLAVDALNDVGVSEGLGGAASSLDTTVRAAGAVAEHFLLRGDRVGMRVFGSFRPARIPPAAGRRQLRRLLDTLAGIEVATDREAPRAGTPLGVSPGATVIMLSALVSAQSLERALSLARRGLTVIVVDTLPADTALPTGLSLPADDPYAALAWRVRLLEREREIRAVREAGIAVVPWRGPGSLDRVLRELGRRAGAPRMVRR